MHDLDDFVGLGPREGGKGAEKAVRGYKIWLSNLDAWIATVISCLKEK